VDVALRYAPEVDAEQKAKVPVDKPGPDPQEAEATSKLRAHPKRDEEALAAVRNYPWKDGQRPDVDLTKIKIPVLAINGHNALAARRRRRLPGIADPSRR